MSDGMLKRELPRNLEAEKEVIGSIFKRDEAYEEVRGIVKPDDFFDAINGAVFRAIEELNEEAAPISFVTVAERLKRMEVPAEICNGASIMGRYTIFSSAAASHYAELVQEKAVLRQLIKANEEIANTCFAGKEELSSILAVTEEKIFNILEMKETGKDQTIREVVFEALDKISQASKQKGTVTGIPTGFLDLDQMTAGMQPSDFVLIAARPSMGKTAFVLNIAQHVAVKKKFAVAIFSLEMSKAQLVNRMFSLESQVDAQGLRTGSLNEEEWDKLGYGANNIANSKIHIDDTASISIADMRAKCRKFKSSEDGLDMIIIDYLQLMSGRADAGNNTSRQQEISEISRSLKAMAREFNVPVLALSQLSRAVEQRPDKRPMLSDLRESGAIEQDADVVMFIYRDDYYNHDSEIKGIAEVIIAKQRNGPVGTVELVWLPEFTKFANRARDFEV